MSWQSTMAHLVAKTVYEHSTEPSARVEASTQSIEVTGPPGTVVFWHQRLLHTRLASTRDRPFVTPLYATSKTHATSPTQIVRRRIYGEHGHLV